MLLLTKTLKRWLPRRKTLKTSRRDKSMTLARPSKRLRRNKRRLLKKPLKARSQRVFSNLVPKRETDKGR